MFRESKLDESSPCKLYAPDNAPLAQGLLEVILDRAYIRRSSAAGKGTVTIHLESWQIDVLDMFGIVLEEEPAGPNSAEAAISERD